MFDWIKKKLIQFHEDRVLYHFKHLCIRYKTGNCPKEKCPYFLRRNPFRTKVCTEEEIFETCPLIDFNDVIFNRLYTNMHDRYERWQKNEGIIKR